MQNELLKIRQLNKTCPNYEIFFWVVNSYLEFIVDFEEFLASGGRVSHVDLHGEAGSKPKAVKIDVTYP